MSTNYDLSGTIAQAECVLDEHKFRMLELLDESGLTRGRQRLAQLDDLAHEAAKLPATFRVLQTLHERRKSLQEANGGRADPETARVLPTLTA